MVCAPLFSRMAEKKGLEWLAMVLAYSGYTWLCLIFIFFCTSILCDVARVGLYLFGTAVGRDFRAISSAGFFFFITAAICAISITSYGYFEAFRIRTEWITIPTDKLIGKHETLTIAQISDVHLGLTLSKGRVKKIIESVKEINPDILVSTGDLLDGDHRNMEDVVEMLRETTPRFGKYAVTGNHEYYAGLSNFLNFAGKTGFRVLRGEIYEIENAINIIGIDDVAGTFHPLFREVRESELLSRRAGSARFTLLLKHRPLVDRDAVGLFDLQLSGHTHDGQIFPFGYLVKLSFPLISGYFNIGKGSDLYVSSGAGTWGPPIRFLAPPEVTAIRLVGRRE